MRKPQRHRRARTAFLATFLAVGSLAAGAVSAEAQTPALTIGSPPNQVTIGFNPSGPSVPVDAGTMDLEFKFDLVPDDHKQIELKFSHDAGSTSTFTCPSGYTGPSTSTLPNPAGVLTLYTTCKITTGTGPSFPASQDPTVEATLSALSGNLFIEFKLNLGDGTRSTGFFWILDVGGGATTGGNATTPDPTAAVVATAREQASAAGVAGSSQGVLVREGAVVPVTSRVSPSVGPRGGVVLEADGLRVAVASSAGARTDSGVVVPSGGDVEVTISGGLVPGAVVEVWVNSDPRLVAAARVPADYEDGDSLTFVVPTGAPLDGGAAVEEGEHTLQLLMYTADGFEVLSTGLTVGGVVPTRIPAGDGPVRLDGVLFALLGAAGLAGFAVRRAVVSG